MLMDLPSPRDQTACDIFSLRQIARQNAQRQMLPEPHTPQKPPLQPGASAQRPKTQLVTFSRMRLSSVLLCANHHQLIFRRLR